MDVSMWILLVIIYLLGAIITGSLSRYIAGQEDPVHFVTGIGWPVVVPTGIVIVAIWYYSIKFYDKVAEPTFDWIVRKCSKSEDSNSTRC